MGRAGLPAAPLRPRAARGRSRAGCVESAAGAARPSRASSPAGGFHPSPRMAWVVWRPRDETLKDTMESNRPDRKLPIPSSETERQRNLAPAKLSAVERARRGQRSSAGCLCWVEVTEHGSGGDQSAHAVRKRLRPRLGVATAGLVRPSRAERCGLLPPALDAREGPTPPGPCPEPGPLAGPYSRRRRLLLRLRRSRRCREEYGGWPAKSDDRGSPRRSGPPLLDCACQVARD